jgi:hypothetical protein
MLNGDSEIDELVARLKASRVTPLRDVSDEEFEKLVFDHIKENHRYSAWLRWDTTDDKDVAKAAKFMAKFVRGFLEWDYARRYP